jgi:hypothetical protein
MEYDKLVTEISIIPREMKKLKRRDEFLTLLARSPPLSVYQIYHDHNSVHKMGYKKNVGDVVKQLLACKLIERVENVTSKHDAHYYKLSTAGIYYFVYNKREEFIELFKILLQQYGKNIMFTTLLYPYLKKSSLENIGDTALISKIYAYLHECCEEIQSAIESTKKSHTKFVVQQVCLWEDVHDGGEDNTRLIDFLKLKFDLRWLDNGVNVVKYNDGGTLSISKGSNRVLIKLHENRTKAILIYNNKELYRFILSRGGEILYRSEQTAQDLSMDLLKSRVESFAKDLVLALTLRVIIDSDIKSLSRDERFMRVLEEDKRELLDKYQMLTESVRGN